MDAPSLNTAKLSDKEVSIGVASNFKETFAIFKSIVSVKEPTLVTRFAT